MKISGLLRASSCPRVFWGFLSSRAFSKKQQEDIPAILYTLHVLIAASLYAILKSFGSFTVSLAWALYALVVLSYAYKNKNKIFARSSLVILVPAYALDWPYRLS